MLERYYFKPDTVDRIRSSWIGEPIERYVKWMSENGYAQRNVYHRVPILRHFGEFAKQGGAKTYDELSAYVEPFVADWVNKRNKNHKEVPQWRIAAARTPVEQLLCLIVSGFKGRGRVSKARIPFLAQAPGFFPFLVDERGLRERTIVLYNYYLRLFEAYMTRNGITRFADLMPVVLSGFVTESGQGVGKSALTTLCCCLRAFLRYLKREGLVDKDLSRTVESPRKYRLSDVPRSISWEDVRRMLEAIDKRTAMGRRDYAILLLLVTYGLRANEVAALNLDHIDWKRERLLVPERKAGHTSAYPLSSIVGQAITEYLRNGRPNTSDRHVFFRVIAPCLPLTHHAISDRVAHYLRKAGINVRKPGSHTLRHTCAQRLLDKEFSFKMIGDYLAHASPESTQIYAKVAVDTLREAVLGNEEEL